MSKRKPKFVQSTSSQDAAFLEAWRECNHNVACVADMLGVSRQAVYNRLESAVPDCYYVVPVDARYYQAVAVSYALKRVWIATGKMSHAAAERFVQKKRNVENITYTERSGKVVTVPKYAAKVVFVTEGGK